MASERIHIGAGRPPASSADLLGAVDLGDLEAVRLLLRGASVIDWHRLAFADAAAVDRFLRVNELDPDDEADMRRLETLRAEAVDYLERNFSFRIPPEIAEDMPARDLLLLASQRGRRHTYACIILKVMHIIHHLAGRELLVRLPIADSDVFDLVEAKVMRVVEDMRAAGYPIVEFAWSRKNADSLVTKLLAKKESIAAHVYDKLRFRLVTRSEADLLPVLRQLTRTIIPFNYVIPGESQNTILALLRTVESTPELAPLRPLLQQFAGEDESESALPGPPPRALGTGTNEFSGPSYRIINFVADLPVKLREYLKRRGLEGTAGEDEAGDGDIVFVLTEFQVMDAATAATNEQGENSHQAYKERQLARVRARLLQGLGRDRGDRTDRTSFADLDADTNPGSGRGPVNR